MIDARYIAAARRTAAGSALCRLFASGEGGRSYLLSSPDALLCECIALAAAAAENGGGNAGRRIEEGLCDDVRVFGREGFRTEDADAVVSLCRLAPAELKRRVFVLLLADSSDAAQNKLLKTLEDAPGRTVFFVAAPASSLLPTVASRLETIIPDAPSPGKEFEGETGENMPYALYGGSDSLTEFDALLKGEKTDSLRRAIRLAEIIGPSARMLECAGLLGQTRRDMRDTLSYFERILGDATRYHGGVRTENYGLFNVRAVAEKFPLAAVPGALKAARTAAARAATGNLAAIADTFVITVSEVMYHAKSGGRQV